MSEQKYACPEEGCTREFYTQVGLDVHMKAHLPVEKVEKVAKEKPIETKTEKPKAVTDKQIDDLNAKYLTKKQAEELWKKRIKNMRKGTIVKVSDKLNKKNFCKMLEVKNWLDDDAEKKFTAGSYTIEEVRKMSNGWFSITAKGNNGQKVSWKEGPIKGRHHITIPKLE